MLWLVPLTIALVGSIVCVLLAARVQREIPPTERALDGFGRAVRPALVRVRDENERARNRSLYER